MRALALEGNAVDEDKQSRDYTTLAGALEGFEIWTPQDDTVVAAGQVSTPHAAWIGGSGYFSFACAGENKLQVRTPSGPSPSESEPNTGKVAAAEVEIEESVLPERLAMVIAQQDAMIENLLSRCHALEAQAAQASLAAERQAACHGSRAIPQSSSGRVAGSAAVAHRGRASGERVRPRFDSHHHQQRIQPNSRRGLVRDGSLSRERSVGCHEVARTTPSERRRMPSPSAAALKPGGFGGAQRQTSSLRRPRVADPVVVAQKRTPPPSPARRDVAHRSLSIPAQEREGSRYQSPTKSGPTGASLAKQSVTPSWSPRRGGRPGPLRCRAQRTQPQSFSHQQQDDDTELLRMSEYKPTLAASPTVSADLTGGTGECMFCETAEPMAMTSSNAFNARKTDSAAIRGKSMAKFKFPAQSRRAVAVEPTCTKQGKAAS
mmetsp:Transcript_112821/g.224441  ORF Transcript_112821/g.224441 Transcript_112821/m.224441 type:complete len:433 (+) Transcript_112821:77-1375(+)